MAENFKMTGKFVAYYRVSTSKQNNSGLGLEAQREAGRNYLNGGDWKLVAEFTEVESGKNSGRPELTKALDWCRATRAVLVIAKLDRLARNVAFLANLMNDGVEFVCCDMPTTNKLTIHVLAAVAEAEAEMISTRTKTALAAAKARGVKLGSPKGFTQPECRALGRQLALEGRRANAVQLRKQLRPLIEPLRASGQSFSAIAEYLNERHITAPRGGQWSATQVFRLMR